MQIQGAKQGQIEKHRVNRTKEGQMGSDMIKLGKIGPNGAKQGQMDKNRVNWGQIVTRTSEHLKRLKSILLILNLTKNLQFLCTKKC